METGMLHTHHLMVVLYMALLLVKTVIVFARQKHALMTVNRLTRIPHIVIATLMLGTGIFLMLKAPGGMDPQIWAKIGLVALSIPLAVVGFKRMNPVLPLLALACFGLAYQMGRARSITLQGAEARIAAVYAGTTDTENAGERGEKVYTIACRRCHGSDGKSGFRKSKDLTVSELRPEIMKDFIRNGQGVMPEFKYLTEQQLDDLVAYVQKLKVRSEK